LAGAFTAVVFAGAFFTTLRTVRFAALTGDFFAGGFFGTSRAGAVTAFTRVAFFAVTFAFAFAALAARALARFAASAASRAGESFGFAAPFFAAVCCKWNCRQRFF
jgi:hypothetical protein